MLRDDVPEEDRLDDSLTADLEDAASELRDHDCEALASSVELARSLLLEQGRHG